MALPASMSYVGTVTAAYAEKLARPIPEARASLAKVAFLAGFIIISY
ncbi:hypothetical protein AO380_1554 [Moraxella catarrhalis]|nr:hypothetical protein AO380_1554 [Moraxella catarrhalis]